MSALRCPSCNESLTERDIRERWCSFCGNTQFDAITSQMPPPPNPLLFKARKQASGALFTIAFIHVAGLVVLLIVGRETLGEKPWSKFGLSLLIIQSALTVFFLILAWWARSNPFAPAAIGLIVYLLLLTMAIGSIGMNLGVLWYHIGIAIWLLRATLTSAEAPP